MDPAQLTGFGIVVLMVLAGVVILSAVRRNQSRRAIGVLSRETRSRDRGARQQSMRREGRPSAVGRELEASATNHRRAATAPAVAAPPSPEWRPPGPDSLGATRREFLNRSITGFFAIGLSGFGAAAIAFLWPKLGRGFGSSIRLGDISELITEIRDNNGFLYKPEGRLWVTEFPTNALDEGRSVYSPAELAGMEAGVVALYQKCPHLGCRVPGCVTSQWFECPCHGSQYNRVGEKKGGPAPRGMDRFPMTVSGGVLTVDTGTIIPGPTIGTNTTGQEAEGPHCVGSTEGGH